MGDRSGQEAEQLFAEFLALEARAPGDFAAWVEAHGDLAGELRAMHADWLERSRLELGLPGEDSIFEPRFLSKGGANSGSQSGSFEARPGRMFGEFRLITFLGEGGMGTVWEAEDLSLGRRVALKFIRSDRSGAAAQKLFEREARAAARVEHPGVVGVHSAGEAEGVRYIAQELVQGGYTLADFLEEQREASELPAEYHRQVAAFFAMVADALAAAHACGVIHRDVKPTNILIGPDRRPRLTDFGLARVLGEASLSEPIGLKGTYLYMSPEQAAAKSVGIDHRCDVFCLGVVLYEALSLKRPFSGDTIPEVLESILHEEPTPIGRACPGLPADLSAIVAQALEKRRVDRYQEMTALADDLRRFQRGEPISIVPPGIVRKTARFLRRRWRPMAVAVTVLLLLSLTWRIVTVGRVMPRTETVRLLGHEPSGHGPRGFHVLLDGGELLSPGQHEELFAGIRDGLLSRGLEDRPGGSSTLVRVRVRRFTEPAFFSAGTDFESLGPVGEHGGAPGVAAESRLAKNGLVSGSPLSRFLRWERRWVMVLDAEIEQPTRRKRPEIIPIRVASLVEGPLISADDAIERSAPGLGFEIASALPCLPSSEQISLTTAESLPAGASSAESVRATFDVDAATRAVLESWTAMGGASVRIHRFEPNSGARTSSAGAGFSSNSGWVLEAEIERSPHPMEEGRVRRRHIAQMTCKEPGEAAYTMLLKHVLREDRLLDVETPQPVACALPAARPEPHGRTISTGITSDLGEGFEGLVYWAVLAAIEERGFVAKGKEDAAYFLDVTIKLMHRADEAGAAGRLEALGVLDGTEMRSNWIGEVLPQADDEREHHQVVVDLQFGRPGEEQVGQRLVMTAKGYQLELGIVSELFARGLTEAIQGQLPRAR